MNDRCGTHKAKKETHCITITFIDIDLHLPIKMLVFDMLSSLLTFL